MLVRSLAFLAALIFGSFFEYVAHRAMHKRWSLGRRHAEHHRVGTGQGMLGEFRDYLFGLPVIGWLGFLYSVQAGIAFVAGAVVYAAVAAYCHQVQHERPELIFWMPRPVHHVHHTHKMWFHNFGITVDVWDRVIGTYRPVEWQIARRPGDRALREYLRIKWY